MQERIFGSLLPIKTYEKMNEATYVQQHVASCGLLLRNGFAEERSVLDRNRERGGGMR